jgi:hypothetical protein
MVRGENFLKILKNVLNESARAMRKEPGTTLMAKAMASASPWFVGVGKNLVVRK